MQARLPALLAVVRWRRRRRRVVRAGLAALLLAVGVAPWWWQGGDPGPAVDPSDAAIARWSFVRDDPGVLARHVVTVAVRSEWFVDDVGLQALLQADQRPAGLVRVGGRSLVTAAATDPFPGAEP